MLSGSLTVIMVFFPWYSGGAWKPSDRVELSLWLDFAILVLFFPDGNPL